MEQKPAVGRIVHYTNPERRHEAAIVTAVHGDTVVSLAVFSWNGIPRSQTSVALDPATEADSATPSTWHWPERE